MKYLVVAKKPIVQVVVADNPFQAKMKAIATPNNWSAIYQVDDVDDWQIEATAIPGTEDE